MNYSSLVVPLKEPSEDGRNVGISGGYQEGLAY